MAPLTRPATDRNDCKVCDNERIVAVGTGAQTDLIPCPACVGVRRDELTGLEREDVEAMCAAEGVPVLWRDAPGWPLVAVKD